MEDRSESSIQSDDSTWAQRTACYSPPTGHTTRDFLLDTVAGGAASPVTVTTCTCGPECEKECCRSREPTTPDSESSDETSPLLTLRPRQVNSLEDAVHCGCHVKVPDVTSKKARNKLIIACILALLFMIGEIVGGYLSQSLAILTDAAHMLSDFASFLISLFAIWVATRKPSKGMSFGWHRAEVLGAVVSVLIIWVVTGVLVYEAIKRCIYRNFEIEANVMLITAGAGVFVNIFMMAVLHQHGHGHSHGGGGHERGRREVEEGEERGRGREGGSGRTAKKKGLHNKNINVHAAFIHVVGDLIQSIGIVIAGYIIWFKVCPY
ncbi:Zinc transporter 2 [Geodia barretti]|uniref:Zinc transporter 2 n=1 Tax=Geodia barretti TaxID=519541 RepID=A0AA35R1T6_GEOBA|nr:Zinc transporter 2 [Geodia barretti]